MWTEILPGYMEATEAFYSEYEERVALLKEAKLDIDSLSYFAPTPPPYPLLVPTCRDISPLKAIKRAIKTCLFLAYSWLILGFYSAYSWLRLGFDSASACLYPSSFCRLFAVFLPYFFRVVFESFSRCISNRLLMECTKTVDYCQRDRGGIARNREGNRETDRGQLGGR